jgi:hypothetical protein
VEKRNQLKNIKLETKKLNEHPSSEDKGLNSRMLKV